MIEKCNCNEIPCRDCKEDCFHAGDAGADCPKYYCDMPDTDCEHCEFIKGFINDVYYGGKAMAKILKYTCCIIDCEYSFYVKTCIRQGVQAYKVIKCCNWYTFKHGAITREINEVNKERTMGIYSTLLEAETECYRLADEHMKKMLTASN